MQLKEIYIIPGRTENCLQPQYQQVARLFESYGYKPHFVAIAWRYKTMAEYVAQFLDFAQLDVTKVNACFGFSYGAMIAVRASPFVTINELFLASLSPYFAEDLSYLPKTWLQNVGLKRVADFERHSFASLQSGLNMPIKLIVGEREPIVIRSRSEKLIQLCPQAQLVVAHSARHDLAQSPYLSALSQWFSG